MKNIFIFFKLFVFTCLQMYKASVNTECAYNSIVHIQACKYNNGNNRMYIFQFLLHLPVLFLV